MLNSKVFILPLLSIAVAGCILTQSEGIDRITPQSAGEIVSLQGQAIALAPFLEGGAYHLENKTGQIWVISNQNLPEIGTRVRMRGRVEYQSIPLGDRDLGEVYLQEIERK